MTDPNSAVTRFRLWLARRLDVKPDAGESWCVNCSLSGGRTLVLPADSGPAHAREHAADGRPAGHHVTIVSAWPARPGEPGE